eukprot:1668410-Prymnesium_polylepis.1
MEERKELRSRCTPIKPRNAKAVKNRMYSFTDSPSALGCTVDLVSPDRSVRTTGLRGGGRCAGVRRSCSWGHRRRVRGQSPNAGKKVVVQASRLLFSGAGLA